MTRIPTTPPFPDQSSAQADLMWRELYSRIQTLETVIRTGGGGDGDDDDPEAGQLKVVSTTPVRLLTAFIPKSVGFYLGGPTDENDPGKLIGVLEPNAIVLSVTASITDVFDDIGFQSRLTVGTSPDHPDAPPEGTTLGDDAWRIFFARSNIYAPAVARIVPWVTLPLDYEWDESDTRQGVNRLLTVQTKVYAQWQSSRRSIGARGEAHVRVLYVDSNPGIRVDTLGDRALLSPIPPQSNA